MKRIISLVLAAVLSIACIAAFAGCGSSSDGGKNVDLNAVLDKINTENNLSLEKVDSTKALKRYYLIDEADVKQFAAEMDKSNTNAPIDIVLVEATNAEAAGRVKSALDTKYSSVVNTYTSYTPEKADMVKACKVTQDGNFISLIISDNADKMVKTYQDSIK